MSRYPIPADALDDRLAILGTSGSGKTYLTLGAIEKLLSAGHRVVAVDPLGVMWGLRLQSDGKTASGFNIPIFGGRHGDLPLTEHAGVLIGETVATMRESCIVDLSELPTKAAERRFMTAFLDALYRHTDASKVDPYHLVIDEADRFAPQKPPAGDETMLNRMEEIVRRGRVKGFIPWLITQRPAVLNKNVLSQADGLVMLRLTSSQDRDQVGAWIEGQADRAQGKAILGSLPAMQRGQGVVWIPGRGILETVQFPTKATFDSSAAPKRGQKRDGGATLKQIDLGALKERLATVEAETKANDPAALKKEVARLTAELRKSTSNEGGKINTADQKAHERALERTAAAGYAQGWEDGWRNGWSVGAADGLRATKTAIRDGIATMPIGQMVPPKSPKAPAPTGAAIAHAPVAQRIERPVPNRKAAGSIPAGRATLPPGERAVLIAAVQYGGVDRDQLSVLTGYKRSSRDAYIQRLREKGLVDVQGQTIAPTDGAADALGSDYQPLPTGEALQSYWAQRLPEGDAKILGALIDCYPNAVARNDLDDATGYKRSSRDAYIQRLKARRLVVTSGSNVTAAEMLF